MSWLAEGFIAAYESGELREAPVDWDRKRILELVIEGTPRGVQVETRTIAWPSEGAQPVLPSIELDPELASVSGNGCTYFATFHDMPGSVDGDSRLMRGLLMIDDETDLVVFSSVFPEGDLSLVSDAIERLFRGDASPTSLPAPAGRPHAIVCVDRELYDMLGVACESLGIVLELDLESDAFDAVLAHLEESFDQDWFEDDDSDHDDPDDGWDGELSQWCSLDQELAASLLTEFGAECREKTRALKRYFGDAGAGRELIDAELFAILPYLEWFLSDYRPTSRSRTLGREGARQALVGSAYARVVGSSSRRTGVVLPSARVRPGRFVRDRRPRRRPSLYRS